MANLFIYVRYSEANFQMSSQYTYLLIVSILVWIPLWLGYRNNKINDEKTKKERNQRISRKIEQREKLDRLYPKKK